ncbi:MAG TPA: hypothetical protein PKD96_00495 [Candidatus Absconditabacterales bacterium]|nr:hypothetical protein [Candidatus Absconditabacterales bacterium]
MSPEGNEKNNLEKNNDLFLNKTETQALQMIKTAEHQETKENFLQACEKKFAIPEKIAYFKVSDSYESFQVILKGRLDRSSGLPGLTAEDIGLMQAYLNGKGFLGADKKPLMIDGKAGKNTYNAIKSYFEANFPEFKYKKELDRAAQYEKSGKPEDAFQIYDGLRQQFPANIVFINATIKAFDEISINDGKEGSKVTKKVEDIYTNSKRKRRINLYQQGLKAEPNNKQILSLAATEFYYDGKTKKANQLFQKVFENGGKLEQVALLYPLAETVLLTKYPGEKFEKVFDLKTKTLKTDGQSTKIDLAKNALILEDGSLVSITPKEHGPTSYQLLLSVAREVNRAKAHNQAISSAWLQSQIDIQTKNLA